MEEASCEGANIKFDSMFPARFVFDEAAAGLTDFERLWLGLANVDPGRDVSFEDGVLRVDCRAKNHPVGFAATPPREGNYPRRWPNVVVMDEATVARVDRRWAEYGLGEFLASPSNRYRKLLLSERAEA